MVARVMRILGAVARPRGGAALLLILSIFAALLASQWFMSTDALGDDLPTARPLGSLKAVAVPQPSNLSSFVRDKDAAIQLGKAFYWDMQAGTDGMTACASCHFKAGADGRTKNTLNPGPNGVFDVGGANFTLSPGNFPISPASDDIVGSQGVHRAQFLGIAAPGSAVDQTAVVPDPVFQVGGTNVRRSTGRNTPSNLNAIFNFDSFWDGRAEFDFNGVNPFGARDPNARVLQVQGGGAVQPVAVSIDHASLASQAVGPPNNDVEMAAAGRSFPQLGRKMLSLTPLGQQSVHPNDSVLGTLANAGTGLNTTYAALIEDAFQPQWWDSGQLVNGFTVKENNFSLYWGLAIQLYESTLVSNDSRFDRFKEGNAAALTALEKEGLEVFQSDGALCNQCHGGPEFTNASVGSMSGQLLKLMNMGDDQPAVYDNGFYNIGVRPTGNDLGIGGFDPFGNPLSRSRLAQVGGRVAVDGAFKTPSLRNVELTGPYFHNGGKGTLSQVLDFYDPDRGDFAEANIANLDPHIDRIRLNDHEKAALLAFMRALTDDRVRFERAPFDHPQLFVPNGHVGGAGAVTADATGQAVDDLLEIPAVGNGGGPPLQPIAPEPPPDDRQGPNPGPSASSLSSSSSPNASASGSSGSRTSTSASLSNAAFSSEESLVGGRIPGSLTSTSAVSDSSGETTSAPDADDSSGPTNKVMGVAGLAFIGAALAMAVGRINATRSRRLRPPGSREQ